MARFAVRRTEVATRLGILVLIGGALLACTPAGGSAPVRDVSVSSPSLSTSPVSRSPAPAPSADLSLSTVAEDRTPVLEIARVPGLTWHERAESETALRTSWFEIPGADGLNTALADDVEHRIDAYRAVVAPNIAHPGEPLTPVPAAPTAGSPLAAAPRPARSQLDVSTTLTAASGDVIGVRLTMFDATPDESALTFTSYYWDAEGSRVAGARDLFGSDPARAEFAGLVRSALAIGGIERAAADAVTDDQALTAVAFRADGTAVAELSQGAVPQLGSIAVPIAAGRIAPLLSDLGRRVQAAAVPGTFPAGTPLPDGSAPLAAGSGTTAGPAAPPNCAVDTCVALTYDDGPVPDTTRLLDTLAARHVPVTFFVVGQMARQHPEILQREIAEGHEVGNHSMSHPKLSRLPADQVEQQVGDDNEIIRNAIGRYPTLARPPYGMYDATVNGVYARHGLQNVIWDVDSRDWATGNADATVAMVDAMVQPGSIVLMHDLHSTTIDAAGPLIDRLSARGYRFVTVSQLLDGTNPQAGHVYSYRPGSPAGPDRSAG